MSEREIFVSRAGRCSSAAAEMRFFATELQRLAARASEDATVHRAPSPSSLACHYVPPRACIAFRLCPVFCAASRAPESSFKKGRGGARGAGLYGFAFSALAWAVQSGAVFGWATRWRAEWCRRCRSAICSLPEKACGWRRRRRHTPTIPRRWRRVRRALGCQSCCHGAGRLRTRDG